jgi:hypothetical protein
MMQICSIVYFCSGHYTAVSPGLRGGWNTLVLLLVIFHRNVLAGVVRHESRRY